MSESSQLDPEAIERLRRLGGDDFTRKMLDLFLSYTEQKLGEARTLGTVRIVVLSALRLGRPGAHEEVTGSR